VNTHSSLFECIRTSVFKTFFLNRVFNGLKFLFVVTPVPTNKIVFTAVMSNIFVYKQELTLNVKQCKGGPLG